MTTWAAKRGLKLQYIQPGSRSKTPISSGLTGRCDTTGLAHYMFDSVADVQDYATKWLWSYNHERPNMALGGITPKQKLSIAG